MTTCRCTAVTLVYRPKTTEVRLTVNPSSLCVRLIFPVHHVVLGELVGFIHFVDGLIGFLRLGPFDVELVPEFLIEFLQLDKVCGDIVVLIPRDERVAKFDRPLAARKGKALSYISLTA